MPNCVGIVYMHAVTCSFFPPSFEGLDILYRFPQRVEDKLRLWASVESRLNSLGHLVCEFNLIPVNITVRSLCPLHLSWCLEWPFQRGSETIQLKLLCLFADDARLRKSEANHSDDSDSTAVLMSYDAKANTFSEQHEREKSYGQRNSRSQDAYYDRVYLQEKEQEKERKREYRGR